MIRRILVVQGFRVDVDAADTKEAPAAGDVRLKIEDPNIDGERQQIISSHRTARNVWLPALSSVRV
ncbi:hypothetical protein GCM10027040_31230 [Halomonas shantousis]